jgi:hypothetical protein
MSAGPDLYSGRPKLHHYRTPSQKIRLTDIKHGTERTGAGHQCYESNKIMPRHSGGICAVFVDGHGEYLNPYAWSAFGSQTVMAENGTISPY